jgi:2,3-bisphosphoglycerate-dependent phosphoglycerate mutase
MPSAVRSRLDPGPAKGEVRREAGERQFMAWRRSYDAPPPPIDPAGEHSQFRDPRYAELPPDARPRGESLRDVTARLLPYWYDAIIPDLRPLRPAGVLGGR